MATYDPDKRKPVKRSGLQQLADKTAGAVIDKSLEVGKNVVKGSPVGMALRTASKAWEPARETVMEDARNTQSLARASRPPDTDSAASPQRGTAQAAEIPQTGMVAGTDRGMAPITVGENPRQGAEQYTPQRVGALSEAATIPAGQERVGQTFSAPGGTMEITGPPPRTLDDGKPLPTNGTYKTDGGLEIAFPQGANQGEMRALLEQPTRPGTQMRSTGAQGRFFGARSLPGAGQQGSSDASPTDGMKRTERIAYNNRLADLEKAELRANTDLATTGMRETGANQRQFGENQIAQEGNEIDRLQAESYAGLRDAQTATEKGNLAQVERTNRLYEEYDSPDTTPERRKEIAKQLGSTETKKTGAKPQYIKPEYDDDGNVRPGTGQWVDPPPDLSILEGMDDSMATAEQRAALQWLADSPNPAHQNLLAQLEAKFRRTGPAIPNEMDAAHR